MTALALDVAPINDTEARQLDTLLSESPVTGTPPCGVVAVGPVVVIPVPTEPVDAEAEYQRRVAEIVAFDAECARWRKEAAFERGMGW